MKRAIIAHPPESGTVPPYSGFRRRGHRRTPSQSFIDTANKYCQDPTKEIAMPSELWVVCSMALLHERLKALAEEKRVSLGGLGTEVGLSRDTVPQWARISEETGETRANVADLQKVATRWGVSVSWLLGEEEDPTRSIRRSLFEFLRRSKADVGQAAEVAWTMKWPSGATHEQIFDQALEACGGAGSGPADLFVERADGQMSQVPGGSATVPPQVEVSREQAARVGRRKRRPRRPK
jgi:transcriptional regulator with XRE-family HTH domain